MPKGNVMTLGTGNYNGNNNLLLIKNVWSKFIQHGPSFSDKTKKSTTFKELQ